MPCFDFHTVSPLRLSSPCKILIAASRRERRATCERKRFVAPLPRPGAESRRRMAGVTPKRNVGPGCVFQHDGRSHHTRTQKTSPIAAAALSMTLTERSTDGLIKYASRTPQTPMIRVSLKNQVSQPVRGVYSTERQI